LAITPWTKSIFRFQARKVLSATTIPSYFSSEWLPVVSGCGSEAVVIAKNGAEKPTLKDSFLKWREGEHSDFSRDHSCRGFARAHFYPATSIYGFLTFRLLRPIGLGWFETDVGLFARPLRAIWRTRQDVLFMPSASAPVPYPRLIHTTFSTT
jgi:hypothetical protein